MKQIFDGFYSLQPDGYNRLWKDAYFIFDTNVLLNLYRYNQSTSDKLIEVISALGEKVWIPHMVGLEYQRNRLSVIGEQNSKFEKVESIISNGISSIESKLEALSLKKRHSLIETDGFIDKLKSESSSYIKELKELETKHFSVNRKDSIREQLDRILDGKVGAMPGTQQEIDDLENTAKKRFDLDIPPGYMDAKKEKSDKPTFSYGNITYNRKYCDYILWSEILEFAKKGNISNIFFISDDAKEDWWYQVKQNGTKTISPRPELKYEIKNESGVDVFHMYSSESFLKHASEALEVDVSEAELKEIRSVTKVKKIDFAKNLFSGLPMFAEVQGSSLIQKDIKLLSVSKKVVEMIHWSLENDEEIDFESISCSLGKSESLLRVNLKLEDTNFKFLVNYALYKYIRGQVQTGQKDIEYLADKTGFPTLETLSDASIDWTGLSISDYIKWHNPPETVSFY